MNAATRPSGLPIALSAALLGGVLLADGAHAIPTTLVHSHNGTTVHWQQPGSPPLPWSHPTANEWNHNHLTADPFTKLPDWDINKAWDNRVLHARFGDAQGYGHGIIERDRHVRFGWGADFDDAGARNAVESAFADWESRANTEFLEHRDPWDHLGIDFRRADSGDREIVINFVEGLQETEGAYGLTTSTHNGGATIDFETTPTIFLDSGSDDIGLSIDGGVNFARRVEVSTPWTFDGTPALSIDDLDIDYRDVNGAFETGAEVGLANLSWNFGLLPALDFIDIFEFDFFTIAVHEVGHAIALGHTGNGSDSIMKDDIAFDAHFGRTRSIDAEDALAVAIAYTYAVPAPATFALAFVGLAACRRRGVRRRGAPCA